MTRSTIFFCPKDKASELSEATGIPILKYRPGGLFQDLQHLREGNSLIVTDTPALLFGWIAPPNTLSVFIEGFSEDYATRLQAEARVKRLPENTV